MLGFDWLLRRATGSLAQAPQIWRAIGGETFLRPLDAAMPAAPIADGSFARRAFEQADPNALRMALIELTDSQILKAMRVAVRSWRGGALASPELTPEDRATVIEHAIAYSSSSVSAMPHMSRERATALLALFGTEVGNVQGMRMALDELGFPDPTRGSIDGRPVDIATLRRRSVTIIGAGVSGLALAMRLKRLGIPFRILERQAGIGGTWHLNDYPEARVDITTFIYQFRSERNYRWKDVFAPQPDIKAYLEYVVERHGLAEHIELGVCVTNASWDADHECWTLQVRTADGAVERRQSIFLISAAGLFSTPNLPDIAGLESFCGPVFHTTNWDHDIDFADKRVGLVGNGSSGVQVMPWLARHAAHLTVFQRSPNWITPVEDYRRSVEEGLAWVFQTIPTYWHWHCYAASVLDKQVEDLQVDDPEWREDGGDFNRKNDRYRAFLERYLRESLDGRPDLVTKCLPRYPPLARRMVVDSGWFSALKRSNVSLISQAIDLVRPDGVVAADGSFHPLDVIVLGTGFRAAEFLRTVDYRGVDGQTLPDLWRTDGARAYLGMFLPGFPNFAIFYGPNGQPQSGSFHDWADRCARLVVDLLIEVAERDVVSFEVCADVYDAYNRQLDTAMRKMIWGREGASGYYINASGRPITKMPWRSSEYFAMIDGVRVGDFRFGASLAKKVDDRAR